MEFKVEEDEIKKIRRYHKNQQRESFGSGITVKLTNKQRKDQDKINKEIKKIPDFQNKYKQFKKHINLENSVEEYKNINKYNNNYINSETDTYISILEENDYIYKDEENYYCTTKGIIAAQINDCNPLLLTEILIDDNILKGLSPPEIVSLLSIFITDIRKDDRLYISEVNSTFEVKDRIDQINVIRDKFIDCENRYSVNDDLWDIAYDYLDPSYRWASNAGFNETIGCLGTDDVNDGNFIKNMLKINNLVNELILLCPICNNIDLLPVLQEIEPLIIRDEVSINSLYLE